VGKKEFTKELSPDGEDRLRVRINVEKSKVIDVVVQYELKIKEKRSNNNPGNPSIMDPSNPLRLRSLNNCRHRSTDSFKSLLAWLISSP
jgi:hypothetical protein